MSQESKRLSKFARNQNLEELLVEINEFLAEPEKQLIERYAHATWPPVFILGPHRSGSTLLMQWLANLGLAYPTNLLSRFYRAPIMGAKLQLLLADERYNYRDELKDFSSSVNFQSENGKTKGALAPNEFWYFWRRFLPFKDLDYLPTTDLINQVDIHLLKAELMGLMQVFNKPIALKAMILNYNIDFLDYIFSNAIFIHVKRDPLANIESALEARKRQLGNINEWYSFKIPEYYDLIKRNAYEQVAGQIYYINNAIESGLANISQNKKMTVNYENFCHNPQFIYDELNNKLQTLGYALPTEYDGKHYFELTRKKVSDQKIINAYELFFK